MVDNFLIRVNEENFKYKFFNTKNLKQAVHSPAITGLSLYENQSKFFKNTYEVEDCSFLSYAMGNIGGKLIFEKKQKLTSLPINTNTSGLEALVFYQKILNLGNSMLESFMDKNHFSYFGVDFIPLDFIQSEKKTYDERSLEETIRKREHANFFGNGSIELAINSQTVSLPIPKSYCGTPKILIPQLIFYGGDFFKGFKNKI